MDEINILIVEDEQIIAENLRFILHEYDYTNVDVAIDATEATACFKSKNYQLVLMDINLGINSPVDGVDLIKKLIQEYTFSYIYITANADEKTLQKVKTTNPAGYIVKPFTNEAVFANVEMALSSALKNDSLTFMHKSMKQQIKISDIRYIKAEGVYSIIHEANTKQHLIRKSLSELVTAYEKYFIRVHKSILINKDFIQGYTSQYVKIDGEKLPIGRSYKKDFLHKIKNLSFL
jgi:DNA-binding LytR/AlgR family response regulator